MKNEMKKILFFIGPSGSGKDTYFSHILNEYQVEPIILLTTRPMRDGEQDGREYHFVTKERMDLLEQKRALVERRNYNTQHGIWSYATGIQQIDLSKNNYLTSNTWEGYSKFLKYYSEEVLIPLYFELDNGVRLERCLAREKKSGNGKYAEMCRRYLTDEQDFTKEMKDIYRPYIIDNNGTMNNTIEQLNDILVHKLKIPHK